MRTKRVRKAIGKPAKGWTPKIITFDVDGVLIDVRGSYWRSAIETVRQLSGKRVTYKELYKWKAKPGHNDDWRLTSNWVTALGRPTSYKQARAAFEKIYWGINGKPGNVRNEKFVVTPKQVERWAKRFELNLFTGRTRKEFAYTFDRWPAGKYFRRVMTMDDVRKRKPDPEGLLKILGKRDRGSALYVGDNVDDALAAQAAGVAFVAILPRGSIRYRKNAARFRELGALAILPSIVALDGWLSALKGRAGNASAGRASKS
jgi:HAD superfamily hydrolase (TIGR01548 family)